MTTRGATRHPTLSLEPDVFPGNNDEMSSLQETRVAASICRQRQIGRFTTRLPMSTYWEQHGASRGIAILIPFKQNRMFVRPTCAFFFSFFLFKGAVRGVETGSLMLMAWQPTGEFIPRFTVGMNK